MLFNISSGFNHNHLIFFWRIFYAFSYAFSWSATGKSIRPCCAIGFEVGWGVGVQGWGGGRSGRVVLIDNGRVYQSKADDALFQVKTTTFGTNEGLNMLLNISSRYFGDLFWSRQLRGLPSSDGYFCQLFSQYIKLCIIIFIHAIYADLR